MDIYITSLDKLVELNNLQDVARNMRRGNFQGRLALPQDTVLEVAVIEDPLMKREPSFLDNIEREFYGLEKPKPKEYSDRVIVELRQNRLAIGKFNESNGKDSVHFVLPRQVNVESPGRITVPLGYSFFNKLQLALKRIYRYQIENREKAEQTWAIPLINSPREGCLEEPQPNTIIIPKYPIKGVQCN